MFKRIVKSIKRRLSIRRARSYKVGQYTITLPPRHQLDFYQQNFKYYDKKLPAIARLVESKYKFMSIIDIGANIGDTAVALRDACNAPIICIEGNSKFIPLLEANLSDLPGIFRVIPKFIGPESSGDIGRLVTVNGTAHIEREIPKASADLQQEIISIATYKELLASNTDLPEVQLVKIDTDGFDFKIIFGSVNQISVSHPILFIEFDPSFSPKNEKYEALSAMDALIDVGYIHYVIFDNFGNYMFSFSERAAEKFRDLFCFLEQSRYSGAGVVYLDVCCFAEKDTDIFDQLVEAERANTLVPMPVA